MKNKIEFTDYPEDKLIMISDIPNLTNFKLIAKAGIEIKGLGKNVSGVDSDMFDVTGLEISDPFYEQEFSDYVNAYHEMFQQ